VKKYVDDLILVSEEEIAHAIAFAWHNYREKIEGSAAAALAALLQRKISGHTVICLISGGNIQPEVHQRLVASDG
jgi:threonine dehydratase